MATMMMTAERMSAIPMTRRREKASSKTVTPMTTAVTGSRAPRIADGVDPIFLMAIFMRKRDRTVGSRASWMAHVHCRGVWRSWMLCPARREKMTIAASPKRTIQKVNVTDE